MRELRLVEVFDCSHLVEDQAGAVLGLVALLVAHVQEAGKTRDDKLYHLKITIITSLPAKDFVDFDLRQRWKPST